MGDPDATAQSPGASEPVLTFEQQMSNVQTITVLWRHYFAENHPGDFKDCTDPACVPFTHLIEGTGARV